MVDGENFRILMPRGRISARQALVSIPTEPFLIWSRDSRQTPFSCMVWG